MFNGGIFIIVGLVVAYFGAYIFPFSGAFIRELGLSIIPEFDERKIKEGTLCNICEKSLPKNSTVEEHTFYKNFLFQQFSFPKYYFCSSCQYELREIYGFMFYKTEYYGVVDTHKKWNKLKGDILSDLGLGDLNLVKQKIDKREQKKEADAKARKKAAEKRKADAKSRAKAAKKKREARRKSLIDKYGKDTEEKIFNKE